MTGEYPIMIDGMQVGKLCIRKEGLMTVFEAECQDPGYLLRLSVYGEAEAYLGVMVPKEDGMLCLKKKLSRNALAGFPETIRYAGAAGELLTSQSKLENVAQNAERTGESCDTKSVSSVLEEAELSATETTLALESDLAVGEETMPAMDEVPFCDENSCISGERVFVEEDAKTIDKREEAPAVSQDDEMPVADVDAFAEDACAITWRKGAGGALIGSCGEARFLAIPLKAGAVPIWENYEKRRIEQMDYAVIEIKNGKIF